MRAVGLGPKGSERKCFEVLHNGGEMKLVARAGKSPEPRQGRSLAGFLLNAAGLVDG
jgi:hypothetical protein